MVSANPRKAQTLAAQQDRSFRGIIGAYDGWQRHSELGCVIVLADEENSREARDMGFLVDTHREANGYRKVFCPGDRVPCWDIARQLGGRPVTVRKDADGYSMFKLLRH